MEIQKAMVEWWQGPSHDTSDMWTLTHGFFVQMGGFLLYDGKTPKRALTANELKRLINRGEVEPPKLTEREINDKSKNDLLTKLVFVVQMTWFVFQCLTRWARDLPVTELEIVTLAFAALNVVIYGLWWKKPKNIEIAVCVQLRSVSGGDYQRIEEKLEPMEQPKHKDKKSTIIQGIKEAKDAGWRGWMFGMPLAILQALWRPIFKMAQGDDDELHFGLLRMSMFYVDRADDRDVFPFLTISFLFGAFHVIPWSFPSAAELWLWRCSALFITAHPLSMAVAVTAYHLQFDRVSEILLLLYALSFPLYFLARIILLVQSFTTLRDLPPGVHVGIEWTSFIPLF